jgi:hypothetical protein
MGKFCYFNGFPHDSGMVHPDFGYDLCFAEVDTMFLICEAFDYHCLLILQSGVSIYSEILVMW